MNEAVARLERAAEYLAAGQLGEIDRDLAATAALEPDRLCVRHLAIERGERTLTELPL